MTGAGRRGVALVGFMGSGKTSVGRALAARTGLPLVDTDEVLAARFGPIPDQIARDGLPTFRARERQVVAELCDGRPRIVATGGGAFADPESRAGLIATHATVHLDVPLPEIEARLGEGAGRPLWTADRAELFRERRAAYEQADFSVQRPASDGPDDWAAAIAALVAGAPSTIRVTSASGGYPVACAPGIAGLGAALARERVVLVTETTVGPLWADAVAAELGDRVRARIVVPAGEQHKDLAQWTAIVDGLLAAGIDRSTAVVALGGGVLGDVAGFAAATTLRGLPFVQVPTTLLAMVDSSVGGKVAINHPRGKNLVGAFHPPELVWMAFETLSTLPEREHACGWGEVVKTGLAVDGDLFRSLELGLAAAARIDPAALRAVIARCVRAKARIVSEDEREAGPRIALNAGHTVGHAIEAALGPGVLPHGVAVGLGLLAETRTAVRLGVCEDPELPARIARLLVGLDLPITPPPLPDRGLADAIAVDKKAVLDRIRVPLVVCAGHTRACDLVPGDLLPDLAAAPSLEREPEPR